MCFFSVRVFLGFLVIVGGWWEEVWLGLFWEGLVVLRKYKGRVVVGSCVYRGLLLKLFLFFLRLVLLKGMLRDFRRKGRGWGILGVCVGEVVELLLSGELRFGGEL